MKDFFHSSRLKIFFNFKIVEVISLLPSNLFFLFYSIEFLRFHFFKIFQLKDLVVSRFRIPWRSIRVKMFQKLRKKVRYSSKEKVWK